jgi:hypothetical protein
VADLGGLGQARGSRRVDVQRGRVERRQRALRSDEWRGRLAIEERIECRRGITPRVELRGAGSPALEVSRQPPADLRKRVRELRTHDQASRGHDADAVTQRRTREMRIRERNGNAQPRESQPHGQVLGTIGHEQHNHVTFCQIPREPPSGIAMAAGGQLAVTQRSVRRHQRRRGLGALRPGLDQQRQCDVRMAVDRRGAFQRPQPGAARKLAVVVGLRVHGAKR